MYLVAITLPYLGHHGRDTEILVRSVFRVVGSYSVARTTPIMPPWRRAKKTSTNIDDGCVEKEAAGEGGVIYAGCIFGDVCI